MVNSVDRLAVEGAARYIVSKLKEERYHPRRLSRLIFLFSGDAIVEHAAVLRAQAMMPFKLETVYLVDTKHSKQAIERMQGVARRVVATTFEDLNKMMLKTPFKDMAMTVCVAVHPQLVAFAERDDNTTEMLWALGITPAKTANERGRQILEVKLSMSANNVGTFYRMWLCHFKRDVGVVWRRGDVCPMSCKDVVPSGSPTRVEPREFLHLFGRASAHNCVGYDRV